jgi:DNA-binding winged helix-turn-helix (wHTH) protein
VSIKNASKISYRIANVIVNPQLNTINNERVEPKVMQLLEFLLLHQGQVCSKQNILDEIWPRQIVADDAVTRLIFVLRSALGDDAKSPQFISTIPKKGYVFLVKATVLSPNKKKTMVFISSCIMCLGILLTWYNLPASTNQTNYKIKRSLPITHQEGREYSYAIGANFNAYFHEQNNLTTLVVVKNKLSSRILVTDHWQKRSLIIVDNLLFYIRFVDGNYQIVQQALDGKIRLLFASESPIYSLSMEGKTESLLFSHYKNNNSTVLYKYSFMSEQVNPLVFESVTIPDKVYAHYYQQAKELLFFVGIDGRKPTIYGIKYDINSDSYQYQLSGFDKIRSISKGKTTNELLVVGTHKFTQGIWTVSLETNEISLIFSHPENDITQTIFDIEKNTINYSFQAQRADLREINLQGKQNDLPRLNSTLIDNTARYSADGTTIFFASNRNGDFELYRYQNSSSVIHKISNLQATAIWHYSFSNDQSKVAIVYSTDHIRLGIVELSSGKLLNSVSLDEIKFPLAWSKDDKHIYISEHLSNIAMYLYDSEQLVIKNKRTHLGLTAFELSSGEVLAFDYQTKRFVAYNFHTENLIFMSDPVRDYMHLAPNNTYTNGKLVMLHYKDDMQKTIYRLRLSDIRTERRETLVANLLYSGNIQEFSPEMSTLLITDNHKNLNGNIVALQLK